MNKKLLFITYLLLLAALLLSTTAFAPPTSPFFGTWQAVDIDGSNLTLKISHRGRAGAKVRIFDDGATVCGTDTSGTPLFPAQFKGRGTISGTTLDFTGRTKCLDHPPRVLPRFSSQLFDNGDGTISDTSTPAVVYTRVP